MKDEIRKGDSMGKDHRFRAYRWRRNRKSCNRQERESLEGENPETKPTEGKFTQILLCPRILSTSDYINLLAQLLDEYDLSSTLSIYKSQNILQSFLSQIKVIDWFTVYLGSAIDSSIDIMETTFIQEEGKNWRNPAEIRVYSPFLSFNFFWPKFKWGVI